MERNCYIASFYHLSRPTIEESYPTLLHSLRCPWLPIHFRAVFIKSFLSTRGKIFASSWQNAHYFHPSTYLHTNTRTRFNVLINCHLYAFTIFMNIRNIFCHCEGRIVLWLTILDYRRNTPTKKNTVIFARWIDKQKNFKRMKRNSGTFHW